MVFEAHCMSFPCTEPLSFNYAKVNTVFHSMAPLTWACCMGFCVCKLLQLSCEVKR